MPARPTQRDRILSALRAAGIRGVRSTDFLRPTDGYPPILRVASRIAELRDSGYPIATRRAANGTAEYWLTSLIPIEPPAAVVAEGEPLAAEPEAGRLFDPGAAE